MGLKFKLVTPLSASRSTSWSTLRSTFGSWIFITRVRSWSSTTGSRSWAWFRSRLRSWSATRAIFSDSYFQLSTITFFAIELLFCSMKRFSVNETDFASIFTHSLMSICISNLSSLSHHILQISPAENRKLNLELGQMRTNTWHKLYPLTTSRTTASPYRPE